MANEPTEPSRDELAQQRTDYAIERTYMAAIRTTFAMIRTGLAIAGGGTLVMGILGDDWPNWSLRLLAGIFVVVGYTIMFIGIRNYNQFIKKISEDEELKFISPNLLLALTILLQIAVLIILFLFLFT